jgi:hypothetical protein
MTYRHSLAKRRFVGVVTLASGLALGVHAQQPSTSSSKTKPKAPLVSVVGCASRGADGMWMLTNATDGMETPQLFTSEKEIEDAKTQRLGTNRYKLVGTAEFGTKEDLLKTQQRAEFTRPEVANATGQLQDGRKLVVKVLLIVAPTEKRLNLVSVQQLAETCK